jgi:hypothetical protein
MADWREMEQDIAFWVEVRGYDAVLAALIATCAYWATTGDIPPIEGPTELWVKREGALRSAQRAGKQ